MFTRWGAAIAFFLGLALATGLIAYQGFADVGQAVWNVGWGILAVSAFRVLPIVGDGLAWKWILGPDWRGKTSELILFRWIRDAVNTLLPVGQVGGDMVGARLLTFRDVPGSIAGASVLVDKTLEVFSLFFFTLTGTVVLIAQGRSGNVLDTAVIGLLVMLPLLSVFLAAQWLGLGKVIEYLLRRLTAFLGKPEQNFSGLNDATLRYYRDRRRFIPGFLLHFAVWLCNAVDTWLVLRFMDAPVSLTDALIIESICQVVRSAGFAVPASAGVQEAGYMFVGTFVGLPAEAGLAISLVKRLRYLIVGVPALAWWQTLEGRRWFTAVRRDRTADD